jgi:hypothetical protein
MARVGGIIQLKVDGEGYLAKGSFTYNIGQPKREAVIGSDSVHGYKELPQTSFIEGVITDTQDLDLEALLNVTNATVTLELANGKIAVVERAFFVSDGNVTTEEGEIAVRFEGEDGREVA